MSKVEKQRPYVVILPLLRWVLGQTLGGATVAVIQGVIVFFLTLLVGFRPEHWTFVPIAFLFMILIAILFTALGTAIASVLEDMQGFQLIMNFVVMPIFFLSGALFPLNGLPRALAFVASIDPLSYGIDGIRGSLTHGSHFGLGTDFIILGLIALALLAIGRYLFAKIQI